MDSPSDGHGPIYLSAIAAEYENYRLEVRSTESWANPARFEVMIEEQREATPGDRDRIAAEMSFAEGRRLEKKVTEESRRAALSQYQKSLEIWNRLGDFHWRAITLYSIGSIHRRLGELENARKLLGQSLDPDLSSRLKTDDWRLVASAWNDLGLTAADLGDEKSAFESLDKALRLYRDHGDRRGEASALNNIGYTYKALGRLSEAVEYFEKALPLRRAENDQLREYNVVNNIGATYDALGEPQKALDSLAQTLQVWRELYKQDKLGDPDRLASALNNTAAAYDRVGESQKALDSYKEALAISRKSGNMQRQASTLNNMGNFYDNLGDPALALEYYNQALALIRNNVKDPKAEANILTQIGQLQIAEGNLTRALEYFKRASAIPQISQREAETLNNLGMVYSLEGNPGAALELHNDALAKVTRRPNNDLRGEAATLNKRSEAYRLLGNQSLALADLTTAVSLWRTLKDQRGEAIALQAIAVVERDRSNLREALKFIAEATNIVESMRTRISSHQLRATYFATQENYYQLNIDLNMKLYQDERSPERLAAALEASERSRARSLMDTLVEAHANITEGADPALLRQEREIEQKLRAKSEAQIRLLNIKHDEQEVKSIARDISNLIIESEQVRDKIRISSPKYAHLTQPPTLTLAEIQQSLDPDTLMLEYSLGDKRSYVWAVTPSSLNGFELPERALIEKTAQRVTTALVERGRKVKGETEQQWRYRLGRAETEYVEASATLGKMVLEPVAALLGNKRLVIVADGALQLLSFGALPATDDQRPLIEDHEIVYQASASVLALQRSELKNRRPARHAVVVLANPVFDKEDERVKSATSGRGRNRIPAAPLKKDTGAEGDSAGATSTRRTDVSRALDDIGLNRFPSLPLSRMEADAIVKLVPKGEGMAALGFNASRATATSPELSNYRIVHFATHGVVDFTNPELSGIVLSMVDDKGQLQDGYLRLHDIYNLNLPADLVVLSACQTGVGKQIRGEGLIALTRGFMYAGAKSVVASLWKVDDAATAALMAEFYKQMFTNGLKPAAALRTAQLNLSQQKRWRLPYYWASFVLQGEWK
jgi:CHAT domain-containing protein/tetratricopeptide (TPR) repeat protein